MALISKSLKIQRVNAAGDSYEDVILDPVTFHSSDLKVNALGDLYLASDSTASSLDPSLIVYVNSENPSATDTRPVGLSKNDIFIPFATIGAAITAAESGDTILVAPGAYTMTAPILFEDGVNFEFSAGATVTITTTEDDQFAFSDNNVSATSAIVGSGTFTVVEGSDMTDPQNPVPYTGSKLLKVSNATSNISISTTKPLVKDVEVALGKLTITAPSLTGNVAVAGGDVKLDTALNGFVSITGGNVQSLKGIAGTTSAVNFSGPDAATFTAKGVTLSASGSDSSVVKYADATVVNKTLTLIDVELRPGTPTSAVVAEQPAAISRIGTLSYDVKVMQSRSTRFIEGAGIVNLINSPYNVVDTDV